MKLWEHYLLKGSAPLWSSTFQKVELQSGAVPFGRWCSRVEQYLSEGNAPEWSSTFQREVLQSCKYNVLDTIQTLLLHI